MGSGSASTSEPEPPERRGRVDRRRARGSATRAAILRAAGELLRDGDPRPSSRRVAGRAGVSRRLVYHYFSGVDLLLLDAVEAQLHHQLASIAAPPARGPRQARIEAVSRQRRALFESVGPAILAAGWRGEAARHREARPESAGRLRVAGLREQLALTFGPEIERWGRDGPLLLDTLDLMTGWEQWYGLRVRMGLSASASEQRLAAVLSRLLSGP